MRKRHAENTVKSHQLFWCAFQARDSFLGRHSLLTNRDQAGCKVVIVSGDSINKEQCGLESTLKSKTLTGQAVRIPPPLSGSQGWIFQDRLG